MGFVLFFVLLESDELKKRVWHQIKEEGPSAATRG